MKKIVLITTGQPSCNPRVVKEADALHEAGFEVTVLYNFFVEWAEEKDSMLLANVNWNYFKVGGSPFQNKKKYFLTRIKNKLAKIIGNYLGNGLLMAERSQARAYDELLIAAKKIKADWYIGHNLGALAIVVKAAKCHNAKAGFDFEDYYRGEYVPTQNNLIKRTAYLESKYINYLSYYSTASDLIGTAVQQDHLDFKGKIINLNNCFSLKQQLKLKKKKNYDTTLQLCWFSQTIGMNRGLEILIDALVQLNNPNIHLTLIGRCNVDLLGYIEKYAVAIQKNIHFAGIIQPELLPDFISCFDVGLALELNTPINRDICLTNKFFTYLLAGNAMILSETSMQLAFNNHYKVGETFKVNDMQGLIQAIQFYLDRNNLEKQKEYNYVLAKNELNWEIESKKLIAIIEAL